MLYDIVPKCQKVGDPNSREPLLQCSLLVSRDEFDILLILKIRPRYGVVAGKIQRLLEVPGFVVAVHNLKHAV